jgi:catechol 2,3-dioxygenase-like lactoylglutathione lyase family enzyme
MLGVAKAYNSFAVDDVEKARAFYADTLGVRTTVNDGMGGLLTLHLAGGRDTMVYPKPDYVPATYTVLHFVVDDVEKAVDELTARGVELERYEGFDQDEKGISRGMGMDGPTIAWFKDPAGNVLAVLDRAP